MAVAVLLVPVAILGLLTLHDVVRRPTLRRLALRNAVRRRGEAVLVVAGALLGTAIITSSFVVGDTLEESVRDRARTWQGPADLVVAVGDVAELEAIVAALTEPPLGDSDGLLVERSTQATVATPEPGRRVEPRAVLTEVDFEAARRFGGEPAATGLADAGPTPGPGEVVLVEPVAEELGIGPGDMVEVLAYGTAHPVTVRATVPAIGIAGRGRSPTGDATSAFLAPGTLERWATSATAAAPPTGAVLLSARGGVFDSLPAARALEVEVDRRLAGVTDADAAPVKAQVLEEADEVGALYTTLFTSIGGFAVIAGILLVVNLFVMLAEERKVELGVLRAVGFKRNHLVRTFGIEGGAYALAAAALGAAVGVAVGRIVTVATASIFADFAPDIEVRFAAAWDSVLVGGLIGLAISLLTVWATSLRIARLNVIRAIRDTPEPPGRRSRRTRVAATAGVVAGVAWTLVGIGADDPFGALGGPSLALLSSIPLLRDRIGTRWAVSVPCALTLAWNALVWVVLPDAMERGPIGAFILLGVVMVGAAVGLVTVNHDLAGRAAAGLGSAGRGLAARLGLAYPLARRFRTGMILGMYAVVVFTLTFMLVLGHLFVEQGPRLTEDLRAGYDLVVVSSASDPATTTDLTAVPGVTAAATFRSGLARFTTPWEPDPTAWPLTGFDEGLLARGVPVLDRRLGEYPDDRAVFEAVLADPALAVVDDLFLQTGLLEDALEPGETFTVIDPATDRRHELTVAGVARGDFLFTGPLVSKAFAAAFLGPFAPQNRAYVAVESGVDPAGVAERLDSDLLAQGVDAETIADVVSDALSVNRRFFALMQGFLALGLLIGIAGLGVVMVRSVRERRRQIGMLRTLGVSAGVVRRSFLLESTFISVQGVALGVGLGLVTAYLVLVAGETFGGLQLEFGVPWRQLVLVALAPLLASLLASALPATAAARVQPAVALRTTE